MLDLALRYGEGPIFLKEIAKRQKVSDKYLGIIVLPLKSAGLIIAERGSHGGYMLSRDPADITLRDVVMALEGSLSLVECVEAPDICPHSSRCVSRDVWIELARALEATLQSRSLEDLVRKYRENNKIPSYNI